MYLTLEVVSPQGASMGANRRRIVRENGFTIGRVPGNDWVIPDQYISKQHARISFANGTFFVENLGRNAIAIGSPGNKLSGTVRHPLRNGDRLFIDQYEMTVALMQGDPPGAPAVTDDPFAILPASPRSSSGSASAKNPRSASIPDAWDGGAAAGVVDTGVTDPLDILGRPKAAEQEPLAPVNWQRAPALVEHFEPPPVRPAPGGSPFDLLKAPAEPPAVPGPRPSGGIPDTWDRTNLTHLEGAKSKVAPRVVTPSPGGRAPGREIAPPKPLKPEPPRRDVRPRAPEVVAAAAEAPPASSASASSSGTRAVLPESVAEELASSRPRQMPPAGTNRSSDGVGTGLQELLRGAGLSGTDMSPEMMQDLGKVLRVVVEGVMDVLRARAEIKSQFRLTMTRIKSGENNPLKHSPNVESALHTLLVQKNPGFLAPVQAFEDAFVDIRHHQVAMLEGLRVAYDSMLESFNPKLLEKEFERTAKRSFGSAKSKFWDLYAERFAQLEGDADDAFRKLFGDVFAEAYEQQLERLKLLGRSKGKR
jgi:type VI secretion system FHA domain protein